MDLLPPTQNRFLALGKTSPDQKLEERQMKIIRPNAQQPTPEELQALEKLRIMIEQAIADGVLTRQEVQDITSKILAQKKLSADQLYREFELYREIITVKIQQGELWYEPPGW
jgi:uncharacterized membrane protein YebE (DUF533 family)